jgi:hypothetical protein
MNLRRNVIAECCGTLEGLTSRSRLTAKEEYAESIFRSGIAREELVCELN